MLMRSSVVRISCAIMRPINSYIQLRTTMCLADDGNLTLLPSPYCRQMMVWGNELTQKMKGRIERDSEQNPGSCRCFAPLASQSLGIHSMRSGSRHLATGASVSAEETSLCFHLRWSYQPGRSWTWIGVRHCYSKRRRSMW